MENEFFQVLNSYFESMEKIDTLHRQKDEAWRIYSVCKNEIKAEHRRAVSLLEKVREWKNGVEVKRRHQHLIQPAPLPNNVIYIEQKGG
jgi:hypothetical protein